MNTSNSMDTRGNRLRIIGFIVAIFGMLEKLTQVDVWIAFGISHFTFNLANQFIMAADIN